GNYIGVLPDGTAFENAVGVSISGADNLVGGTTADARNVISGNLGSGILIKGASARGNLVRGNYVGIGPDGTTAIPNGQSAIFLSDASSNTVGGNVSGAGNVVSGNRGDAITVDGVSAVANVIQGNLIGTDRTGLIRVPNGNIGISVVGAVNTAIGGPGLGRNVVSGNVIGIQVRANATGTAIQNNYIGLDAAASAAISNRWGVMIVDSANGNTVGGISPGVGNVISGNTTTGVEIAQNSQSNLIQGNLIGTDPSSNTAIANGFGVYLHGGASGNTIGGSVPGAGNVISGNQTGIGVFVDEDAPSNVVAGNRVGTNAAGTTAVPNGTGIRVSSANNTIGGTTSGSRNLVSGNSGPFDAGITIAGPAATGNVIQGNFVGTDVSG